jgi:pentafunctional AROM polypeptide
MGAAVRQDEGTTTIRGPNFAAGEGLRGIDVNMAEQTDCFMTLAAVAAVASGRTRITGIANQRVKECNRIAATVAELRKLGVEAGELPDGIEILGSGVRGPRGERAAASAVSGEGAEANPTAGAAPAPPPPPPPHGGTVHC